MRQEYLFSGSATRASPDSSGYSICTETSPSQPKRELSSIPFSAHVQTIKKLRSERYFEYLLSPLCRATLVLSLGRFLSPRRAD